jgi:hypothetical protein
MVDKYCLLFWPYLCLLSSDWAAWVQAIGSILAIAFAGYYAWYQARKQHQSAMALFQTEQHRKTLEMTLSLSQLARTCLHAANIYCGHFKNVECVFKIATGEIYINFKELSVIETALESIPLMGLPHGLITAPLQLHSDIRQMRHNIELAIQKFERLDSSEYEVFYSNLLKSVTHLSEISEMIDKAALAIHEMR